MINKESIRAVDNSVFGSHFSKPLYKSYCFSLIPQTIQNAFTGNSVGSLPKDVYGKFSKKYKKVILFFIDAFGWHFFSKYKNKYPFLKYFLKKGVVSKLTSQFPSTTANCVTCINTGLPVGESGIYEWNYYEPKFDAIISPLLFSYSGKKVRDTLVPTGTAAKSILPNVTVYKKLKAIGVDSYIFQHSDYTPSAYSDVVFEGATKVFPYVSFSEALTNLVKTHKEVTNPSYFFLYFDKVDGMGHKYGPTSPHFEAEVDTLLNTLNRLFLPEMKRNKKKDTLFLFTADHGQSNINPKTTFYLNLKIPEIIPFIQKNKKGELLVQAGSPRDLFLHIKKDCINKAQKLLQEKLVGKAEVIQTAELIKQGFFGKTISKEFLSRVGNLVILSYDNESIWWYEKDIFEQKYFGHHGGLTRNEMEIPLLLCQF